MSADSARLRKAFGTAAWKWLRLRLRQCIANERPLPKVCVRTNPSDEEWRAAAGILGRKTTLRGHTLRVPVAALEARLVRAGLCTSLREALEALDGPIPSRPAAARRERERWAAVAAEARILKTRLRVLLAEKRSDLDRLVNGIGEADVLGVDALRMLTHRDPAAAERLLVALGSFFRALANEAGGVPRSRLAAEVFGDSHALDINTTVYRALARLALRRDAPPRDVWKVYGVLPDEVSSSVLLLNMRFHGGRLASSVNRFADEGEPCRLLLRHCRLVLPKVSAGETVYVCENPAVLESAATSLGGGASPLVCTEGQPSLACQGLLTALSRTGVRLCYHGDFDWGGIRIANYVREIAPTAESWRHGVSDYRALADGCRLEGVPVDAVWDAALRPAMEQRGEAFHEEQFLPRLLEDLSGGGLSAHDSFSSSPQ